MLNGDGKGNGKKKKQKLVGVIGEKKKHSLDVQHTFLYISLPLLL